MGLFSSISHGLGHLTHGATSSFGGLTSIMPPPFIGRGGFGGILKPAAGLFKPVGGAVRGAVGAVRNAGSAAAHEVKGDVGFLHGLRDDIGNVGKGLGNFLNGPGLAIAAGVGLVVVVMMNKKR
jgi:hypothetical protein